MVEEGYGEHDGKLVVVAVAAGGWEREAVGEGDEGEDFGCGNWLLQGIVDGEDDEKEEERTLHADADAGAGE